MLPPCAYTVMGLQLPMSHCFAVACLQRPDGTGLAKVHERLCDSVRHGHLLFCVPYFRKVWQTAVRLMALSLHLTSACLCGADMASITSHEAPSQFLPQLVMQLSTGCPHSDALSFCLLPCLSSGVSTCPSMYMASHELMQS